VDSVELPWEIINMPKTFRLFKLTSNIYCLVDLHSMSLGLKRYSKVAQILSFNNSLLSLLLCFGALSFISPVLAEGPEQPVQGRLQITTGELQHVQAQRIAAIAERVAITGAAVAGKRIVAVGDHGAILLSDDAGKTFRQAKNVPTRITFTSVSFADAQHGWAAGHWGAIFVTTDGGENWTLQRDERKADLPLLTIWFKDAQNGYAAGIWSTFLRTQDGGKTWNPITIPAPPGAKHADLNLFKLFSDSKGELYIVAERGLLLHSKDDGDHWEFMDTGNKGSLWAGVALRDGTLVVGGLLGKAFASHDGGKTWQASITNTESSITDLVQDEEGKVIAVGLDGVSLVSTDSAAHFKMSQRDDRLSLTAIALVSGSAPVMFSKTGVAKPEAAH
jgi:photosystem II stability/assembly factor-like uncharacterized protein